ncbi:PqqD family protein [bacterium]|nr:PqqD family protein [bacterium]MBT7310928.1 PqqD family protein [bacterium]
MIHSRLYYEIPLQLYKDILYNSEEVFVLQKGLVMTGNIRLQELAVNESGFVFDPHTGLTYTANETARYVIEQLKAGSNIENIVEGVKAEFDADGRDVYRHVLEFIHNLQEQGLSSLEAPGE